jgi:hypothetical protein
MVLNHGPLQSLGGLAPVTVFTGLKRENPAKFFLYESEKNVLLTSRKSNEEIVSMTKDLVVNLEGIHKELVDVKEKRRRSARSYMNRRTRAQEVNFDVGDYVLVQRKTYPDKLISKWIGPMKITKLIGTSHVYEVEDLLSGNKDVVHCNRLKFYSENLRNTEAVKDLLGSQTTYEIEELLEFKDGQVLVRWKGFEDPTWESLENIQQDVPELVANLMND